MMIKLKGQSAAKCKKNPTFSSVVLFVDCCGASSGAISCSDVCLHYIILEPDVNNTFEQLSNNIFPKNPVLVTQDDPQTFIK